MTKLKKEHIKKIESLLNLNFPAKYVEETIRVSATRQSTITTGANIFTFDQATGLLIIHFELENRQGVAEPLDLTDVRHVILGYQFVGEDGGIIEHEPHIIDVEQGIVAMIMPNQFDWSGTVYVHTFIQYLDGRAFDAGLLQMQWTRSWLDTELPQLGQLEISRFTELIMQIHTMAGVAVGEMQGQLDEFERQLLLQIGNLQSTMDGLFPVAEDLQRQIDVGGLITGEVFGELRESVEGIATERVEGDLSWITVEESLEGKVTDIKFEGRTFVNLWSDRREDFGSMTGSLRFGENGELLYFVSDGATGGSWNTINLFKTMFKANATYTIVLDLEMSDGIFFQIGQTHAVDILNSSVLFHENGRHIATFTTRSQPSFDLAQQLLFSFRNLDGLGGVDGRARITIIEGDVRHLIENHTDPRTLVSSKPSMMRVVGENLFDGELELGIGWTPQGVPFNNGGRWGSVNYIPVHGGRLLHLRGSLPQTNWRIVQFDMDKNFVISNVSWVPSPTLNEKTRYITITQVDGPLNNPMPQVSVSHDFVTPFGTPHQSQQVPIEVLKDGTWQTPTLRAIMNGAQTLVADTIESDGSGGLVMVQRVGVLNPNSFMVAFGIVDTNTIRINLSAIGQELPNFNDLNIMTNRLPTVSGNIGWVVDRPGIYLNNVGHPIVMRIPRFMDTVPSSNQLRQYLIDNDYEFLVPLAEPITYPVRPINLDSFEPVTHVQITSGPVSPSTSFKIATSVGQRLGLLTQRVRKLEYEFRNQLQQLATRILRLEEVDNNEE